MQANTPVKLMGTSHVLKNIFCLSLSLQFKFTILYYAADLIIQLIEIKRGTQFRQIHFSAFGYPSFVQTLATS